MILEHITIKHVLSDVCMHQIQFTLSIPKYIDILFKFTHLVILTISEMQDWAFQSQSHFVYTYIYHTWLRCPLLSKHYFSLWKVYTQHSNIYWYLFCAVSLLIYYIINQCKFTHFSDKISLSQNYKL